MFKTAILCAAIFVAFFTAEAAVKEFRSGVVLAAELSAKVPEGINVPENSVNNLFARMVIKLAPERKISIHDYQLRIYGMDFKAAAICINDGKWLCEGEIFESRNRNDRIGLLFIVDGSIIGRRNVEYFEIIASPDKKAPAAKIGFKNIFNSGFTRVTRVPSSGNMVE